MINRVFFCLCAISIWACTTEPLQLLSHKVSEAELTECQHIACPEVKVVYVEVTDSDEIAEGINYELRQSAIKALYLGESEAPPKAKTIVEAIENFIAEYRMENAEYPGMSAAYFAEIGQTVSISTPTILSIGEFQSMYTGGAHGSSYFSFLNFDPSTGERMSTSSLFKDMAAVRDVAEKHFKEMNEIPLDAPINSKGHSFQNDQFHLSTTVGFTASHMVLYYNDYEIASYVDGPSEVNIPIEEVIPYLSFSWELE